MLRTIAKRLIQLTPYHVSRRRPVELDGHYDVIEHNSVDGMDRLFSNPAFLAKYNSPGRKKLHATTLEWIVAQKPPEGAYLVGDFGCGPADFFVLMARAYTASTFYGYDFSPAVVRAAQHGFPPGAFQQHDIYTPPPLTHDITVCSQTLEHLVEPDVALARLIEATKTGGLLVLTVPDGRRDTYNGHINFWSKESWTSWLSRHLDGRRHEVRHVPRGASSVGNLGALIFC